MFHALSTEVSEKLPYFRPPGLDAVVAEIDKLIRKGNTEQGAKERLPNHLVETTAITIAAVVSLRAPGITQLIVHVLTDIASRRALSSTPLPYLKAAALILVLYWPVFVILYEPLIRPFLVNPLAQEIQEAAEFFAKLGR